MEFKQRFDRPVGILIGLVCQFVLLPLAGFASIRFFYPDDPVHGIPLLVTVCSPGGSYSNWWCSLFNSDLPLSMAMTTASSLLAIATLPINLLIYLKLAYPSEEDAVAVDWAGLFTSLAVVVVGIVSGLLVGSRRPHWRASLGRLGNLAGVSLVLIGFFFSSNSSSPIWARDADFYLGVAVPCVFGLAVSLGFAFACGLPKPQCLSVTIETCYQNTAIPLAVILSSFSNYDENLCASVGAVPLDRYDVGGGAGGGASAGAGGASAGSGVARGATERPCDVVGSAAGVPTFYQVVQILALGIVCFGGWKAGWTYAPPHHALFRILTKNYQPVTGEAEGDAADDPDARLSHGTGSSARAREAAASPPTNPHEAGLEMESVRVEVTTTDPKTTTVASETGAPRAAG